MSSGITKEFFGKTDDGNEVYKFTQTNKNGLVLETINYGAMVVGIKCPDKNGKLDEITLGFDDFEGYYRHKEYFGSTVGRVCNRIANATFEIDGTKYQLSVNDPPNCHHGGFRGFDRYVWDNEVNKDSVTFSRTSIDGEEGFPGRLEIQITYGLNDSNEVYFTITATTEKPTIVNITNHCFFNLIGQTDADVLKHVACISADSYLPSNEHLVPTGKIVPVKDASAFDFTEPKEFGKDIDETPNKGYDNTYCLPKQGGIGRLAARVTEPTSGRSLEVYTTQPGVHLYSSNHFDGNFAGRNGIVYKKYGAFCLETQNFPDAVNHANFPNCVLRPGDTYQETTIYKLKVVQ